MTSSLPWNQDMNPYPYELQLMHNVAKVASLSLCFQSQLSFLPAPRHFVIEKINKFFSPCPEHYYSQRLQNLNCNMPNLCKPQFRSPFHFSSLPSFVCPNFVHIKSLQLITDLLVLCLLSTALYSFYILEYVRPQVQNIAGNVIFRSDSIYLLCTATCW